MGLDKREGKYDSGDDEKEKGNMAEVFSHANAIGGAKPTSDRIEDGGGPGGVFRTGEIDGAGDQGG